MKHDTYTLEQQFLSLIIVFLIKTGQNGPNFRHWPFLIILKIIFYSWNLITGVKGDYCGHIVVVPIQSGIVQYSQEGLDLLFSRPHSSVQFIRSGDILMILILILFLIIVKCSGGQVRDIKSLKRL